MALVHVGGENKHGTMYVDYLPGYYTTHGTLLNVMWQPECEGSLGENGYVYMHDWAPLLSTWNYHNVVNQLYFRVK